MSIKSLGSLGRLLVALLPLLIASCAATPTKEEWKGKSDHLLERQLHTVDRALAVTSPTDAVLLYFGFAMHSQSKAFEGDALLGKDAFAQLGPRVHSVILSNRYQMSAIEYPFASLAEMQRVFERAAEWTQRRKARVVVLVSTHGHVDGLTVNIANSYWPALRPTQLKAWLDALGNTETIVILSACYSGSFIEPLKAPNRIILTAAAADRQSFGCHPADANTYFVDALLRQRFAPGLTWQQLIESSKEHIEARERHMGIAQGSLPQLWSQGDAQKQQRIRALVE